MRQGGNNAVSDREMSAERAGSRRIFRHDSTMRRNLSCKFYVFTGINDINTAAEDGYGSSTAGDGGRSRNTVYTVSKPADNRRPADREIVCHFKRQTCTVLRVIATADYSNRKTSFKIR